MDNWDYLPATTIAMNNIQAPATKFQIKLFVVTHKKCSAFRGFAPWTPLSAPGPHWGLRPKNPRRIPLTEILDPPLVKHIYCDKTEERSVQIFTAMHVRSYHSLLFKFRSTRSLWLKISGTRGRLPSIIFARIVRPMNALQICRWQFSRKETL